MRDEHWHLSGEHQTTTVWKRGGCYTNGINRIRDRGGLALLNEILGWDFGSKEQFLQRMKDWENATLEYNRTSSAPLQEEVLVAVLNFSVSEGSSDIPACTSAGGYGEVESCATVAI